MDINENEFLWVEKYRPHKIADCILPAHLKNTLQKIVDDREVPNLMFTGGPGMGKTTAARAICEEIGLDHYLINASMNGNIETLRTNIVQYASAMSLTGGRKVIILDEADYLNAQSTQPALRGAIEEFSQNCSFVFTANYKDRIIPALHSRMAIVDFHLKNSEKPEMAKQFFARISEILKAENVTFDKSVVVELIKKHFPDYRRIIGELQRYSKQGNGNIDVGILAQVQEINLGELVKFLKAKDFIGMRKWAGQNNDADWTKLFRQIYDKAYDMVKPGSVPQLVVTLADYMYKAAFVADLELNAVACLTELMIGVEWI